MHAAAASAETANGHAGSGGGEWEVRAEGDKTIHVMVYRGSLRGRRSGGGAKCDALCQVMTEGGRIEEAEGRPGRAGPAADLLCT